MEMMKKTAGWILGLALLAGMVILFPALTKAWTCGDYEYLDIAGGAVITKYKGNAAVLEIPDTLDGLKVTEIGLGTFADCSGVKSITLPSSITSIGDYLFTNCSGLKSITIPESIMSIGDGAFGGCSELESITIPSSVTNIGTYAFAGCSGLKSITIPPSVTNIEEGVCSYCNGLTTIIVSPENPVYDSRNGCNAIIETKTNTVIAGCKNTVLPTDIASIGSAAFFGCSGLISVTLPESVTSIGTSAFYNCINLKSIKLPERVTSIGSSAFQDCNSLKSITIPKNVTNIGNQAFLGCTGLKGITIPSGITKIEPAVFCDCSGLKTVYYTGTEEGKDKIQIDRSNEPLENAVWHCNYVPVPSVYHAAEDATCTVAGSEDYWENSKTGEIYADEQGTEPLPGIPRIKALGHSWNRGIIKTHATYTKAGQKVLTCTRCKARKTASIPKLKKKKNPLKVTVAKKTFKRSKLKKGAAFRIKVKKAKGKVTFQPDKKARKAKIRVTKKGKVTIPKNCRKGLYKITVKAGGGTAYKAGTKVVTIRVK